MTTPEIAIRYVQSGLSVIPIRPDGSKAPDVSEWKRYQQALPTPEECFHFREEAGIAVICGAVSGNLEVIDCDDAASFTAWAELAEGQLGSEFFGRLMIVKTPRPGFHVYFRCDVISGNTKLAQVSLADGPRPQIKTLIETRGEGGYVLAPGSPAACHETGRTYQVAQGAFSAIPRITPEQREALLSCARSFNQVWREDSRDERIAPRGSTVTVGSDFCGRASWSEILKPHGFKPCGRRGDSDLWTRPGKDHGVSASTNHAGSNLFYSFSTNCFPFDSERGYNKFAVYALLNHEGNFVVAAKALAAEGYGNQPAAKHALPAPEELKREVVAPSALFEKVQNLYENGVERGVDPGWSTVRDHWTLRRGEWTLLTGQPSHGKSSFVDALMMNLSRRHGWKWAVWSAENLPQEMHIVNLLEQYVGKPFHRGATGRMTADEIKTAMVFIESRVRFLSPPDSEETIPRLLALAEVEKIDGLVIDPWNELTHDFNGSSETNYISAQLKTLGRFVKKKHIHAIVVAHPAKLTKEKIGGEMKYPVPTPYDIAGSAHFRNKADCCLCMWRDESQPGTSTLFVQKIRRRFVGHTGHVLLNYDTVTGRFTDPNHRPTIEELMQSREPGCGPEEEL